MLQTAEVVKQLCHRMTSCVSAEVVKPLYHRMTSCVSQYQSVLVGCVSDSQSVPECQSACRNGLTSSSSHIVQRPRFISSDSTLQRRMGKFHHNVSLHTYTRKFATYLLFPRLNLIRELARLLEWKLLLKCGYSSTFVFVVKPIDMDTPSQTFDGFPCPNGSRIPAVVIA